MGLVEGLKLKVISRKSGSDEASVDEIFYVVVVCNGHFTKPHVT